MAWSVDELRALPGDAFAAIPPDPAEQEAWRAAYFASRPERVLAEGALRRLDGELVRVRSAILEEADGRFRALFYPVERPTTKLSARMYRIGDVLAEWRPVERRLADIDPASPEGAELQAEVDVLRSQYQALVKRAGGGELVASGTKTKRLVAPASNPARMIGSPSACA